ncbi:MAG: hypothetical protein ACLP1X_15865, partial [Polyangiaceae bacterium]
AAIADVRPLSSTPRPSPGLRPTRVAGGGAARKDVGRRWVTLHASSMSDDRFEIQVGDRRVRVPSTFDSEALRRLLAALEGDR